MKDIEWWRKINRIDGSTLEWHNHEKDNSAILASSIKELEDNLMTDRYNCAKPIGFCFNPPICNRIYGNSSSQDIGIVCCDGDGNAFWFHINKATGQHWIRKAGGSEEDLL